MSLGKRIFAQVNALPRRARVEDRHRHHRRCDHPPRAFVDQNKSGERDPEMHQVRKGNQWYFGMKAHVGVDAGTS